MIRTDELVCKGAEMQWAMKGYTELRTVGNPIERAMAERAGYTVLEYDGITRQWLLGKRGQAAQAVRKAGPGEDKRGLPIYTTSDPLTALRLLRLGYTCQEQAEQGPWTFADPLRQCDATVSAWNRQAAYDAERGQATGNLFR